MIQAALRLIVTLTLGMLAVPLLAGAQPTAKIPRIGVLQVGSATATESLFEAFKQGMREHGYVEGQHVVFERRLGEARAERISDVAAELVRLKVDIIVTSTDQGIPASAAAASGSCHSVKRLGPAPGPSATPTRG